MLIEQPPKILRWLYPGALWRMNPNEKAVYLTFDDGPIPEITPWVLDLLDKHQIKATFFLVGDNVRKHPKEFQMILDRGHRVGNHTFNHIGGFRHLSFPGETVAYPGHGPETTIAEEMRSNPFLQ